MWAWAKQLMELERDGIACVLATLTRCGGSTPAPAGAKLLLASDGRKWGTVGGGALEATVLAESRRAMDGPITTLRLPLSEQGQCCGGLVEVLLEPLFTASTLHILGAGHVAQELVQVLMGSRLRMVLVDTRPEWLHRPDLPPRASCIQADPVEYARSAVWRPGRDLVLVLTHSHELDRLIMDQLLGNCPAWVGLIGSRNKWRSFRSVLSAMGHSAEALDLVHCPVGNPQVGKAPREVAIALAQQVLADEAALRLLDAQTVPVDATNTGAGQ